MSASMFPARAGMSRRVGHECGGDGHVPRASGDEPQVSKALANVGSCSPRERG